MKINLSIIKSQKKSQYCIDLCLLPFIGFLLVYILTNSYINFNHIIYENKFILIDYWFFIHVINTNIVVIFYPYYLSIRRFWGLIIGWEILENLIIPNINENFYYFREDIKDTIGDLIAPIPSILLLYNINNYKNNYKNNCNFNKFKFI
jgi:hypothetical protein